jgi:hypothetical protein
VEEVIVEDEEDLVEETSLTPQAAAAIAGRMGGVASWEILPGGVGTDLP